MIILRRNPRCLTSHRAVPKFRVNTRGTHAFKYLNSIMMCDASGQRAIWKLSAIALLSCFFLLGSLRAQAPPPASPAVAAESAPPRFSPEELNQLLAPVALYPDALVALILPASTVPSDLVLAARYLSSNGDPAQVANQPWDDSVKSLVRYPDVVKWMDQNLEWTTQVGEAFLDQPADVMNAIQQLRARAIAAGNLIDTPQQRIVKEKNCVCVRIVPAEPEVIYVPQYDPDGVYVQPYAPYLRPALTFGVGFAVGSWLNYDCDWPRRRVCVGDWHPGWKHDWNPGWTWNRGWKGDWNRKRGGDYAVNVVNIDRDSARFWEPGPRIRRQHWQRQRNDNFDVNGRRGDARGAGPRFPAVARPLRRDFGGGEYKGAGHKSGGEFKGGGREYKGGGHKGGGEYKGGGQHKGGGEFKGGGQHKGGGEFKGGGQHKGKGGKGEKKGKKGKD
jgi:hypothetical protein